MKLTFHHTVQHKLPRTSKGGRQRYTRLHEIAIFGMLLAFLAACSPAGFGSGGSQATLEDIQMHYSTDSAPVAPGKSQFKRAGEIASQTWINSEKLDWASLRGKVVVVNFWTFACYNCKNTLPYIKSWDENYRTRGLVVLGVHTPELSFEQDVENVRKAVKEYNIQYPVAIDGDFANWNRYNVWAWPTWFIVDKEGYVRYTHVGEGDYAGSEKMIQQLLAE